MIDKDYIIIVLVIIILSASVFVAIYNPHGNNNSTPTDNNLFYSFTSIKSFYNPNPTTPTITTTSSYTVTIVANNTETIPISVTIYLNSIIMENSDYSITIYEYSAVANTTTYTMFPEIDEFIVEYANMSEACSTLDTTILTGTDTFWPELFLSHYGYTTAMLTKIEICNNEYFVTAN